MASTRRSEADLEASYAHLDALADELYEDDMGGTPYLFAVMALLFAVQSALQPEAKLVQTSCDRFV
jgi:hypothetical protein